MHFKEYMTSTWIAAFFMFARFIYYPVMAPYIKSAGLNDFQTGLVLSVFGIVVFFSAPIIGHLSDKLGRKVVMLFGVVCSIISLGLYVVDQHWLVFAFARGLMAIGFVSVTVIGIARVEDHLGNKERGKYSGWSLTLIDGARIFAPPIGGLIADFYFVKFPFFVGIVLLAFLLVYLIFSKKKQTHNHISRADWNVFALLKNFVVNKRLRGMAILGMAMHSSIPVHAMFIPILIRNDWGMPYRYVGYVLFAYMLSHILQFALGKFADKIGSAKAVMMGTALYGITLMFFAMIQTYSVLLIMMFVVGLWGSLWNVSAWAFMSDIGEKSHKEGEVVCSYMSWAKMGSFMSFAIGGFLVMTFGLAAYMVFIGLLIVIVTMVAYPLLTHKA